MYFHIIFTSFSTFFRDFWLIFYIFNGFCLFFNAIFSNCWLFFYFNTIFTHFPVIFFIFFLFLLYFCPNSLPNFRQFYLIFVIFTHICHSRHFLWFFITFTILREIFTYFSKKKFHISPDFHRVLTIFSAS